LAIASRTVQGGCFLLVYFGVLVFDLDVTRYTVKMITPRMKDIYRFLAQKHSLKTYLGGKTKLQSKRVARIFMLLFWIRLQSTVMF